MTIPQVVLNQHFKKYRTTASGMAFSGGCVGSFLFPILLEYLLKTYGLAGSFLILGGIIMNVIPAAMVLRKPSWLKEECKIVISKNDRNTESNFDDRKIRNEFYQNEKGHANKNKEKHEKSENGMDIPELKCYDNPSSFLNSSDFLRDNSDLFIKLFKSLRSFAIADDDKELLAISEDMQRNYFEYICTLFDNSIKERYPLREIIKKDSSEACSTYTSKYIKRDYENAENEIVLSATTLKVASVEEFYNSLSKRIQTLIHKDLKSIQPLFSDEEWVKVSLLIEQMKHIFKDLNVNQTDTFQNTTGNDNKICHKENDDKRPNTFKAHLTTAIKLHKNPLFLLISFSRSVHFLTFVPAMTIIVDFSMDKGLLEEDGKYVIAAISFGDLMGRLCLGWITDKEYLSLPR